MSKSYFVAAAICFTTAHLMGAPPPAIEFTSLMKSVKITHRGLKQTDPGRILFGETFPTNAVFMPADGNLAVVLSKQGSSAPIKRLRCAIKPHNKVWSTIEVLDAGHGIQLTESGDYRLTFVLNQKPITTMDFSVSIDQGDDAFEPDVYTYASGPWEELAFFHVYENRTDTPLKFNVFTRKYTKTTTPKQSKMTIQLFRGDELVAEAADKVVAWAEWLCHEADLKYPMAQGGRKFSFDDLVKVDGSYTMTTKQDGQLYGNYHFTVADGKIVEHDRQKVGVQPATRWLVPRKISSGLNTHGNVYWLDRSTDAASSHADGSATPPTTNSASTNRKRWQVIPTADPGRSFEVVHTRIQTRRDTPIAAGDGIVAYATGRTTGVAYFRVGENQQRSIPNGQQYRSDLFHACGKLIVLANRNNLFVHDTVSARTESIQDSDIHMRYQKGALYGPRFVDADGYLVATVNEPTKVHDRSVIKVLDLSGDEPSVIAMRNVGFTVDDVSSIKVSAKHGYVAVGSKRQQAIFVAPVAARAELKKYDISGYDSFGEMDMALLDKFVVYQDAAGFASLRVLNLESGDITTPDFSSHGGSWGTTVATNGEIVTWPTRDPRSTFVLSEYFRNTRLLSNSGRDVSDESNYGDFGVGNSAVVAHDGTIFIAGSQSLSASKCLQMAQEGKWNSIRDAHGQPIPAIDVVLGDAMIAFKTGKRSASGPVTISYATFGERIEPIPSSRSMRTPRSIEPAQPTRPKVTREPKTESKTRSRFATEFLEQTLENERTIYNALKQSVSEKHARKQAVTAALNGLKKSGNGDLIDEYKRRSALID